MQGPQASRLLQRKFCLLGCFFGGPYPNFDTWIHLTTWCPGNFPEAEPAQQTGAECGQLGWEE